MIQATNDNLLYFHTGCSKPREEHPQEAEKERTQESEQEEENGLPQTLSKENQKLNLQSKKKKKFVCSFLWPDVLIFNTCTYMNLQIGAVHYCKLATALAAASVRSLADKIGSPLFSRMLLASSTLVPGREGGRGREGEGNEGGRQRKEEEERPSKDQNESPSSLTTSGSVRLMVRQAPTIPLAIVAQFTIPQ